MQILPLYDTHFGSQECNEKLLIKTVDYIRRHSKCYTFLGGDIIECVIPGSKGSVHKQKRQIQEQVDKIVEILKPIKNKILFSICGNHEYRVEVATGLNVSKMIADLLGVEYAGFEKHFLFSGKRCYAHHGTGGGGTAGAKVNSAERLHFRSPFAEIIFSGHCHFPFISEKEIRYLSVKGNLRNFIQTFVSCGSAHASDGYASMKGLTPLPMSMMLVDIIEGGIEVRKIRI